MHLPKDSKTKVMKPISKAKAGKEVTSSASKSLKFPVDWSPYPFQLPLWRYL